MADSEYFVMAVSVIHRRFFIRPQLVFVVDRECLCGLCLGEDAWCEKLVLEVDRLWRDVTDDTLFYLAR